LAFSFPRRVGLDMRHRLPGLSVGLAASLRSMPTALHEGLSDLVHRDGHLQTIHLRGVGQGEKPDTRFLSSRSGLLPECKASRALRRQRSRSDLCRPPATLPRPPARGTASGPLNQPNTLIISILEKEISPATAQKGCGGILFSLPYIELRHSAIGFGCLKRAFCIPGIAFTLSGIPICMAGIPFFLHAIPLVISA